MSMVEEATKKSGEKYRCPLCGYGFTWEEAERCQVCPFLKSCNFVMCPNCKYEFPRTTVSG